MWQHQHPQTILTQNKRYSIRNRTISLIEHNCTTAGNERQEFKLNLPHSNTIVLRGRIIYSTSVITHLPFFITF